MREAGEVEMDGRAGAGGQGGEVDGEPQVDGGGERRTAVDHGMLTHEDELAGGRDRDGGPGRGAGAEGAGDQPGLR